MDSPEGDRAAQRGLSAGRLRRLLEISALVRRNPRLRMNDVLRHLSVSRSQFYRDREVLSRLGLRFGRAGAAGFTLDQDPLLPPVELALSELLALTSAVAALARAGDAEAAYLGLRSLLAVCGRLPGPLRGSLTPFVEEVVLGEGFGCPLQVLETLEQAVAEGRRIVVRRLPPGGDTPETLTLDPAAMTAGEAPGLRLEGFCVERQGLVSIPLAEIEAAGFTPFLTPELAPTPETTPQGEK